MFTPGPWKIDTTKSFYVFGPAHLLEQADLSNGPFVCNASTQDNARLIAAAPDMYNLLTRLNKQLKDSLHLHIGEIDELLRKINGEVK